LTGQGRNSEAVEQMRLAWGEHIEILEHQPMDRRGLVNWYQMLQVVLSGQDPAEFEKIVSELADGQPSALSLVWAARVWSADVENLAHAVALLDTAAGRCPADDNELRAAIGLDRGHIYIGLGKYREAAASFEEIVALAVADPNVPDHALALNNAAFLYVEYLDDPGRAAAYAERADKVKPDDPSILDTLGWALCRLGKYTEAKDALQLSMDIRPSPDNQLHFAWVLYETGAPHPDVRNLLLRAESLGPSPATQAQIDELNNKLRR
jgi:tetratricopeptide (TPR) repeat protein